MYTCISERKRILCVIENLAFCLNKIKFKEDFTNYLNLIFFSEQNLKQKTSEFTLIETTDHNYFATLGY